MEPTGHCPFVGLKQNRAIRFSSPTAEHRCYVGGDPIDIPVDQTSYCLSRNHTQCPLYMGLTPVTTSEPTAVIATPPVRPTPPTPNTPAKPATNGFTVWMAGLSPRDRMVYVSMIGLLAVIIAVYIIAGLQSLGGVPAIGDVGTTTPATQPNATAQPEQTAVGVAPSATAVPPTPTNLPTSTPSPRPTSEPTKEPVIFPPTATAAPVTTTAIPPTATAALSTATAIPPTATARPAATSRPRPTAIPQPTAVPQPSEPTAALPPTPLPVAQPTAAPVTEVSNEYVWLYFGDTSGTLFVPVQRRVQIENRQVARAAILALLEGPHTGLSSLLDGGSQLLGVAIKDGTATVNFDRDPARGDGRGYDSLALTLTHFSSVSRIQIQVQGKNLGGTRARPVVNPINPLGLPVDTRQTEFLPLYFLSSDGYHRVRVIRMVPKTRQTAEGTVRALLEGPGGYGYALVRTIPEGTDLRGISISEGIVNVDFTETFANTGDRATAVRTVTDSLTTLPGVRGVRFFIEGSSMGDWWGAEYGQIFERGLINGE